MRLPFIITLAGLSAPLMNPSTAWSHEVLSNRHQLRACVDQSVPTVIPYATVRTTQLGLPADIGGNTDVVAVYGERFDERVRIHRRGFSVQGESGGVVLQQPTSSRSC